jgi:hypothetical protein
MNNLKSIAVMAAFYVSSLFGNNLHMAISKNDARDFLYELVNADAIILNEILETTRENTCASNQFSPLQLACSNLTNNNRLAKSMVEILGTHFLLFNENKISQDDLDKATLHFLLKATGTYHYLSPQVQPQDSNIGKIKDHYAQPRLNKLLFAIEQDNLKQVKEILSDKEYLLDMRHGKRGTAFDVALSLKRLRIMRHFLHRQAPLTKETNKKEARLLHLAGLKKQLFEQAHLSIILSDLMIKAKTEAKDGNFFRNDSNEIRALLSFMRSSQAFKKINKRLYKAGKSVKKGCTAQNLGDENQKNCEKSIIYALEKIKQAFSIIDIKRPINITNRLFVSLDLIIKKCLSNISENYAQAMMINFIFLRFINPIFLYGNETKIKHIFLIKQIQNLVNYNLEVSQKLTNSKIEDNLGIKKSLNKFILRKLSQANNQISPDIMAAKSLTAKFYETSKPYILDIYQAWLK